MVLALIHTTCSHCQQFTVVMNILAREYTPRGVQFLECAFNDDARMTMPELLASCFFTAVWPLTLRKVKSPRVIWPTTAPSGQTW